MPTGLRINSPKMVSGGSFTQSPKSISSYIKDLAYKESIAKELSISALEKSTSINTFIKIETETAEGDDPTELKSILSVLKLSSKGKLFYPIQIKNSSSLDDACDLKYIGGLSHGTFSESKENSFKEPEICEPEEEVNTGIYEEPTSSLNNSFKLDCDAENEIEDEICPFKLELLMTKLQLDQLAQTERQARSIERRKGYIESLTQIREYAAISLQNTLTQEQQNRQEIKTKIQAQIVKDTQETESIELIYAKKCSEKKVQLLQEVEKASQQAAAHVNALMVNLKEIHQMLEQKLAEAMPELVDIAKGSDLYTFFYEQVPVLISENVKFMTTFDPSQSHSADEIITEKNESFTRIFHIIKEFLKLNESELFKAIFSDEKKKSQQIVNESKSELHTEPATSLAANVLPDAVSSQPLTVQQSPAVQQSPEVAPQPLTVQQPPDYIAAQSMIPPGEKQELKDPCELRYDSLKTKYQVVSAEANQLRDKQDNTELRAALARIVGIINQLNNSKFDSSNRGKLQHLINLLSGRSCAFGTQSAQPISIKDNGPALAFVKEQLSSRLVSLSHDIQLSTMAVYASLIVRLWQLYPDLGENILFKIYETCPFLVPITVKKEPNQTEEDYNRALGFKQKDGSSREPIDKYLTRMGSAAQLYGRIIAINTENHPHGIEEGWSWIARTLSKDPYPSITASLLNGFLSTAGNSLLTNYKQQFHKVLRYLCSTYMPLMEKETLTGGQSDMASLKALLQKYMETGNIPPPEEGYSLLL